MAIWSFFELPAGSDQWEATRERMLGSDRFPLFYAGRKRPDTGSEELVPKSQFLVPTFGKIASVGFSGLLGDGERKSNVYGHISVKTPDLVRSPKISTVELS